MTTPTNAATRTTSPSSQAAVSWGRATISCATYQGYWTPTWAIPAAGSRTHGTSTRMTASPATPSRCASRSIRPVLSYDELLEYGVVALGSTTNQSVARVDRSLNTLRMTAGHHSVVTPSKCSLDASASAFVTCTVPSSCSGGA
jgi:hypothetical protein